VTSRSFWRLAPSASSMWSLDFPNFIMTPASRSCAQGAGGKEWAGFTTHMGPTAHGGVSTVAAAPPLSSCCPSRPGCLPRCGAAQEAVSHGFLMRSSLDPPTNALRSLTDWAFSSRRAWRSCARGAAAILTSRCRTLTPRSAAIPLDHTWCV